MARVEIKENLFDHLLAYAVTKPDLRYLVLFGSWASGRHRPDSDIDVACDFGRRLTADELVAMSQDLSSSLGREVDLVDLHQARGALLSEILVRGIVVFRASAEETARLLKKMWYDQADDGYFRQKIHAARMKRMTR